MVTIGGLATECELETRAAGMNALAGTYAIACKSSVCILAMIVAKYSLRISTTLLILIQGEHVQHVTFAVDQQHPPAVDDTLQITG